MELLTGATHNFEEGDTVILNEVVGMNCVESGQEGSSVNGLQFKVIERANRNSFVIDCDCSLYTSYERNGLAKQVKSKV